MTQAIPRDAISVYGVRESTIVGYVLAWFEQEDDQGNDHSGWLFLIGPSEVANDNGFFPYNGPLADVLDKYRLHIERINAISEAMMLLNAEYALEKCRIIKLDEWTKK